MTEKDVKQSGQAYQCNREKSDAQCDRCEDHALVPKLITSLNVHKEDIRMRTKKCALHFFPHK